MYSFMVDGLEIEVSFSKHAFQRSYERSVYKEAAYGVLESVGEDLLDLKNGEKFCVMDSELGISVLAAMYFTQYSVSIEVITVLDSAHFHTKQDTHVFHVG